ncbi:hypothetical protein [Pontiella agarivorans]|uniref:DUF2846 domain-containing protein n=1 Tax=Pontiella agarivorans TaxID=3038953 RepID=A0ABU5N245_9BACT|nr:hypothetical protein [Pontiella agarivorans]MDZ8120326.1 hypothetical protein [Pontiella agarivorans]
MKFYLSICCLLVLLSGCASKVDSPVAETVPASVEPPVAVPAEPPVPVFGKLTLIRIEPEPAPSEVLIHMDGELAAVIGNESFVTMTLPAGTNTLELDWEDSPLKFEEVIVLEPELQPEKYLSLIRKFDVPEITKTTNSTDVTMVETIGFLEIPPAFGKSVIENLDPDFSYTASEYVTE